MTLVVLGDYGLIGIHVGMTVLTIDLEFGGSETSHDITCPLDLVLSVQLSL